MDNNAANQPTNNNNSEDDDREPKATPLEVLDQVHSDLALAMDVMEQHHHQQNAAVAGSRNQDEDEDEEEEEEEEEEWSSSSDDEADNNDYEFFDSQGVEEADFEGFLEGQGSNSEGDDDYDDDGDEMEEDDIDPDEMTYEELMALGEFIGPAEKRGLSMEEILGAGCLRRGKRLDELSADVDRCVICQAEYYEEGEEEEVLAEIVGCGHPYHEGCITNWLLVKKSCPICGYEVSPTSSPPSNLKNNADDGVGGGLCNN